MFKLSLDLVFAEKLHDVVGLYVSRRTTITTDDFEFADADSAYDALRSGDLRGRAVIKVAT